MLTADAAPSSTWWRAPAVIACRALAGTLRDNAPIAPLLDSFQLLHSRLVELSACVQGIRAGAGAEGRGAGSEGGALAPDHLALNTAMSILFTLYSRVRGRTQGWRSKLMQTPKGLGFEADANARGLAFACWAAVKVIQNNTAA